MKEPRLWHENLFLKATYVKIVYQVMGLPGTGSTSTSPPSCLRSSWIMWRDQSHLISEWVEIKNISQSCFCHSMKDNRLFQSARYVQSGLQANCVQLQRIRNPPFCHKRVKQHKRKIYLRISNTHWINQISWVSKNNACFVYSVLFVLL